MSNVTLIHAKSQRGAFRKSYFFAAIVVVLSLLFVWSKLGYPQSLAEARFLFKLKSVASENVQQTNLTDLMPGDWETVCQSYGYDGSLYLEKYEKTFPSAGAMRDGAWGLIFIKSDGTYEPISSSCGQGVYIDFSDAMCFSREKSILIREKTAGRSNCASFEMTDQLKSKTEV